jgi:hypothetical protein
MASRTLIGARLLRRMVHFIDIDIAEPELPRSRSRCVSDVPAMRAVRIEQLMVLAPLVSRPASPFQAQGEISPGKNIGLRCAIIGSTSRRLGHESFAVSGPLVLPGSAFYPIPVRRAGASLPASFTPASRNDALRFASLAVNASTLPISAHGARRRRLRPGIGDAEAVDAVLGATAVAEGHRHFAARMQSNSPA